MTTPKQRRPKPGDMVVLTEIPPGLLNDLPVEDQTAIADAVGKPMRLNEYDEDGRAELEFVDRGATIRFIYVKQNLIAGYPKAEG
jgi:hypothetical protein